MKVDIIQIELNIKDEKVRYKACRAYLDPRNLLPKSAIKKNEGNNFNFLKHSHNLSA